MKKKPSKLSKSSEKKTKIKKNEEDNLEKFLIKRGDELFIVNKFFLESLPFQEVLSVAENTYIALKKQIYLDAIKGDHQIQDIKIVEALQRSLEVLCFKHPILQDYVRDQCKFRIKKEILA